MAWGSSAQPGFAASGAVDENRFARGPGQVWRGQPDVGSRWWQIEFRAPRWVGAFQQVVGDHEFVFTNAPTAYVWQASDGGDGRIYVFHNTILQPVSSEEANRKHHFALGIGHKAATIVKLAEMPGIKCFVVGQFTNGQKL